jgi:hypothetical protein
MSHQHPSRWRHLLADLTPPGQFLRPASDALIYNFTPEGGPASCYQCIDDESPKDADYIEAHLNTEFARIGLSSATDPQTGAGHVLRWRWRAIHDTDPVEKGDVQLLQGSSTLIANGAIAATIPTEWRTQSYTLTPAEADAITNYATLQLRFRVNSLALDSSEAMQVSWAELEIPAA